VLQHLREDRAAPVRTVVIGAGGFVGGAVVRSLTRAGASVVGLTRQDVDLLAEDAGERLASRLESGDAVVFVSAEAPCKNAPCLVRNLTMAEAACAAFEAKPPGHLVYVSSDAVYVDGASLVSERTCRDPSSLHGAMHVAREVVFQSTQKAPVAVLRPSLLYGATDPHNGYGPNRFRRAAQEGGTIQLIGEGEEQRDHVAVEDVAELVWRVLERRSTGVLNVATGVSTSFREIAERVVREFGPDTKIVGSPRTNPVTHRHFDATDVLRAFPTFRFTSLEDGLRAMRADLAQGRA